MRQDQIDRLQDLSEAVGDVFMEEANPENWSGGGGGKEPPTPLAEMDEKTRGNRYWDKKNAIQTGALLARIIDLRDRDNGQTGGGVTTAPEDAEKEIGRFEKQAKELLRVVGAR